MCFALDEPGWQQDEVIDSNFDMHEGEQQPSRSAASRPYLPAFNICYEA